MIRRFGIVGAALAVAVALSGLAASWASAAVTQGPKLTCYEVSNFKAGTESGNWSNATCTTEAAKLTSKWVLAEPVAHLSGTELWCAKLTPYIVGKPSETGTWSSNTCKTAKSNGEFVQVKGVTLTEFSVETGGKSSQTVTSTFENPGAGLLEGKIVSTELTSEQAAANKKEGTFHIDFKNSECKTKLGNGKAHSKGDAEGVILVLGKYKIVGWLGTQGTTAYTVLELEPVEIECVSIKLTVTGSVIGTLGPKGSKTKKFETSVKTKEEKQEYTAYLNDKGEEVKAALETEVLGKKGPSTQSESVAVGLETTVETELL